jgi:hypothetical protein
VCRAIRADAASEGGALGVDGKPFKAACDACAVDLGGGGFRCGRCGFAAYCCAPCKSAHWDREHGKVCELVREAKDARKAKAEADAAAAAVAEAERLRKHALRRAHVSLDVGRLGAVETVGALRVFPEDVELAVKALDAFGERINTQAAVDAGAVAAIVATMRAHADDSDVAYRGCLALRNIAMLPAGGQVAIDAGAPATIVAVMRAHASVAGIASYGCSALGVIAVYPAGHQAVVDAGAIEIVIASLHAHVDVTYVALYGCGTLGCFARLPAGKAAIIAAGGRAAITAAKRHVSVVRFADEALAMLE